MAVSRRNPILTFFSRCFGVLFSASVWTGLTMGGALIIFSLVLDDANVLERVIDDRRSLLAEFESLRTTVDGFRDLPPRKRATTAPQIELAVDDLRRRWRRARPSRDAIPRLSGKNPDWTLVLDEQVHK